ncbi:MAG: type II secretion system protein J [Chthoniobacterales bacterium]
MRRPSRARWGRTAFTLAEVMVATAAIGLVATVMFALSNFGLTMLARNVAVNMAHQQARNGLMRVTRDVHQAVSIPQLVDPNLQPVASNGPAAGVTFQIVTSGPYRVMNDPTAGSLIQIETPDPKPAAPVAGDHMVVLDYNLEADITKITATGTGSNHWNVFLANGVEQHVQNKKSSFLVCYITRRIGYVVSGSELRFYPNLVATPSTYVVIARNITSPTPFKVPLNDTGTPDSRYTSVTLSAMDPTYSNRAFKGTSMQLVDARVPYRCQMTKYQ